MSKITKTYAKPVRANFCSFSVKIAFCGVPRLNPLTRMCTNLGSSAQVSTLCASGSSFQLRRSLKVFRHAPDISWTSTFDFWCQNHRPHSVLGSIPRNGQPCVALNCVIKCRATTEGLETPDFCSAGPGSPYDPGRRESLGWRD